MTMKPYSVINGKSSFWKESNLNKNNMSEENNNNNTPPSLDENPEIEYKSDLQKFLELRAKFGF